MAMPFKSLHPRLRMGIIAIDKRAVNVKQNSF